MTGAVEDPFFGDDDAEEEVASAKPRARRPRVSPLWVPPPPGARPDLDMVTFEQRRVCHFKKKPKEGDKQPRGCARCGKNKGDNDHLGAPGSFNAFGSGANQHAYQGLKHRWQEIIQAGLEEVGLPKGLGRVLVDAEVCFGDRTERDQGNFRVIIEKAMGDALQDGGWLPNDTWDRYEFGRLTRADPVTEPQRYKGENWTRFLIFPSWPVEEDEALPQRSLL